MNRDPLSDLPPNFRRMLEEIMRNQKRTEQHASQIPPNIRRAVNRILALGIDRISFSIEQEEFEPELNTYLRPFAIDALVEEGKNPADYETVEVVFSREGDDLNIKFLLGPRKVNDEDAALKAMRKKIADAVGVDAEEFSKSFNTTLDAMLDAGIEEHDCGNPNCGITKLLQQRKREREQKQKRPDRQSKSEKFEVIDVKWIRNNEPLAKGYNRYHYSEGFPQWLMDELTDKGFNHPEWFETMDVLYRGTPPNEQPSEGLTAEQFQQAALNALAKVGQRPDIQMALLSLQFFGRIIAMVMLGFLFGIKAALWTWNEVLRPILSGLYYAIGATALLLTFVNLPVWIALHLLFNDGDWLYLAIMSTITGWGVFAIARYLYGVVSGMDFPFDRMASSANSGDFGTRAFFAGVRTRYKIYFMIWLDLRIWWMKFTDNIKDVLFTFKNPVNGFQILEMPEGKTWSVIQVARLGRFLRDEIEIFADFMSEDSQKSREYTLTHPQIFERRYVFAAHLGAFLDRIKSWEEGLSAWIRSFTKK